MVRKLWTLELLHVYRLESPPAKIHSIKLGGEENSIFLGLETGRLLYIAEPREPLAKEGHVFQGFA